MKNSVVACVVLCATLALGACVGKTARDNVLLPTTIMAWEGVAQDVQAGPTAVPDTFAAFDAAMRAGDRRVIPFSAWPAIRDAARANILAEPNAADASKLERLTNMDEAMRLLQERNE
jgi:hypothetical protein